MAKTTMRSSEVKAFCENVALMLSVGVQTDEAVHMLSESSESRRLESVCKKVYGSLIKGAKLSEAMRESGAFPQYALDMVAAGETTGHVENTLTSLAVYYDEEDRLVSKIRSSVTYPTVLLCIMSVVLAFTVSAVLPIFLDVYQSMAGGLATSSFSMVDIGIIIGWIALVLTIICTIIALIALISSVTDGGRQRLLRMLQKVPGAKAPFYALALSRFTATLSVYLASGFNSDDAMRAAVQTVDHPELRQRVEQAYASMIEPIRANSLLQAVTDYQVYDPIYLRMLSFGMRSGRVDDILDGLSEELFADSIDGFDRLVDSFEPTLAGFVTVAVGLTLIAVMLPLVGIMGSVG